MKPLVNRFCIGVASFFILSGNTIPPFVYANELRGVENAAVSTSEASVLKHSPLFEDVSRNHQDKQMLSSVDDKGNKITQILDEQGNILVAEIYNISDNTFITTSSDSDNAYIETTDTQGHSKITTYKKENIRVPRTVTEDWVYTGIAIPRGAIDNLVNLGTDAAFVAIGGLFGIGVASVNQLFATMGLGLSLGEMTGRALDVNGNGWIALYKRPIRAYTGGPITSYEHKTN